jgi:hypothetical protein
MAGLDFAWDRGIAGALAERDCFQMEKTDVSFRVKDNAGRLIPISQLIETREIALLTEHSTVLYADTRLAKARLRKGKSRYIAVQPATLYARQTVFRGWDWPEYRQNWEAIELLSPHRSEV